MEGTLRELIVAAGLINLITRLAATVPAYAQEWQINRFQDRMSDMSEHEATLSVPEGSMTVSCVVGRKALLITFGSETYLGATGFQRHRRMQYRIDGNPAVEPSEFYQERGVLMGVAGQKLLSAVTPESKHLLVRLETWDGNKIDLDFDVSELQVVKDSLTYLCQADPH
jgi:hypothetical protein